MPVDLTGFNANEVEPNVPREVLPAGWYKAVIIDSEDTPTKAGTGSFIKVICEIVEGKHAGRKLTDRLNLNNPNDEAVRIANGTLSAICHAVGIVEPSNSAELHDRPLMVLVKVKPASGQYGPSNEVAGYEAVSKTNGSAAQHQPDPDDDGDDADTDGEVAVAAKPVARPAAKAAPAPAKKAVAGKKPPWKNK